jgi:succinate dehydrogenase / fumarate reductase membrane anchor subunit
MEALVKASMRSPVGAHYGTGDWLLQRLTAVIMAAYTVVTLACVLWHVPSTYADWKTMFAGTPFRLFTMLFFASLLYHAWVGMRDIVMDYVRPTALRLVLEVAVGVTLACYLIWSASILWGR